MQGLNRPSRCIFCGGPDFVKAISYDAPPDGENYFDLQGQTYSRSYDRCRTCEHHYGVHGLDLSALYESQYVDSVYGDISGMDQRLRRILSLPTEESDNAARVTRVEDFASRYKTNRKRLLDIGAGIGVFPATIRKFGWDVTAIETDQRTVTHLRKNVEVTAFRDSLFDLEPNNLGDFDAITFNKVLEHVEEPIKLLSRAAKFLASDGFIYVELPDVLAAEQDYYREEFFIEHHHVFSPASYTLLAERANLLLINLDRFREPSGKFSLAGFMKLRNTK